MGMVACTICGNPVDTVSQPTSRTGGKLKEGIAHEVCHLRHIASVRLERCEELQERVQELQDILWEKDHPQGLVQRVLRWLLLRGRE